MIVRIIFLLRLVRIVIPMSQFYFTPFLGCDSLLAISQSNNYQNVTNFRPSIGQESALEAPPLPTFTLCAYETPRSGCQYVEKSTAI